MFLTRLDTVGFKSFAERIQMDFVPGVTAVVGPNGSGKSNIIDAIRWVLGEQSAKSLRGQKMEDIIFQGSDTRKALNFAEVTLMLNNRGGQLPLEYQEIHVTRRAYRSGDSEFFINKQACRLKDIVDLFMDTGLGRESFSIIGQGKIDEILSSKSEERRAIFEEAAGVLKYKQRKQKAEYKLSETADNLDRTWDIIHEIEQQMTPLKKQAEIAKQYKMKKAVLQRVEVALLITEIDNLHEEWLEQHHQLEKDQFIEIENRTNIQKKEARLTRDRETLYHLNEKITTLQNELLSITEQLEQTEGKRNVLTERSTHMDKNKQNLLNEQKQKQDQMNVMKQKLHMVMEELQTSTKNIHACQKEMNHLKKKLSHEPKRVKAEIENKKSDYIECLNKRAILQSENQAIEKALQKMTYQEKKDHSIHQEIMAKGQELKTRKQTLEEGLRVGTVQITEMNGELEDRRQTIKKAREHYDLMLQKLYEGNEKTATLKFKKDMLENMKDSFEGYFYGVKEILKAKQQGKLLDIEGIVLDIIHVPSAYLTAVDTVLGAQAQYIVVASDHIARKTISWLKRGNKGRATFLPLQSIMERQIPNRLVDQIRAHQGFIGIASDLVHTVEKYKKVLTHLLGNVIITDNLTNAGIIAKMTERRYRIVTLEGDMVYPGGSMAGGAKKTNNQSLFTREKEIQQLIEKLNSNQARCQGYQEKIEQQKTHIHQEETDVIDLQKAMDNVKQQVQEKQRDLNALMIDYHAVSERVSFFKLQSKHQLAEETELLKQKQILAKKLGTMQQMILDLEREIEQLSQEEKAHRADERQVEALLHEQEIHLAGMEERKRFQLDQLESRKNQLEAMAKAVQVINQQLGGMMNEAELRGLEQSLDGKIADLKTEREQTNQMLTKKVQERQGTTQKVEDEEKEVQGLSYQLDTLTKRIQETTIRVNRLDVALENRLSTVQVEYRMTFEKAMTMYEKVDDLATTKEHVATIKREIKQLGTVNLGAIEEYERLSERYEFLQEQQGDLLEAKKTLFDVIREMDEEMTKRFSAVFAEIQTAFTTVFTQLFGGGKAQLVLTDPTQMLETGIDITAKPPGKKLKTLGLLSGGERALTAIALLFAILHVRPVPFCILDEVDAALDEANVERFSTYLQSFSKDTQFIVITHRRGTMEEAGALYGITMQESGVSRLVSVKLENTRQLVETT
jgi:chromosome segregation protein